MIVRTAFIALISLIAACDEPIEGGAAPQANDAPAAAGKAMATASPAAPVIDAGPRAAAEAAIPDARAAFSSCLLGCDEAKVATPTRPRVA